MITNLNKAMILLKMNDDFKKLSDWTKHDILLSLELAINLNTLKFDNTR